MKEREEEYEADCEELEKLGPYELHEQVARSESGEVKLYRARHETSGVAALVLKPDTEAPGSPAPAKAWQAHCIASTSPSYLAVEVPHTDDGWLADSTPPDASGLARPLPKGPFKGQKRPPCEPHTEVELVGGCWMPHERKAPCPNTLFEHEGKCYVPGFYAPPSPNAGDD